jgi:hypothetical protein
LSVSKEIITKLVDRLVRMPAQDKEDFGVKVKDIRDDIGRAIQRHAVSNDHADRSIQNLIEQCKFRPTESDIREFCSGTSAETAAPEYCDECDHTGWVQITRGGLTGVKECACRKAKVGVTAA